MEKEKELKKETLEEVNQSSPSLLKVDTLFRGSHGLNMLLKTDDVIVALNGLVYKGTSKSLNQNIKSEKLKVLTIFRKETFFNVKATGPLGLKLVEVGSEDAEDIIKKTEEYLKNIKELENFNEYEVYKGRNNFYDVIEVNDRSLLASLLPFVWFFHHKLYSPLLLLLATFILLGSIEWWLFLASWVITTIYMSKGSMSLLRGYCLFNEMKPYMKVLSPSSKEVQEIIRKIDKKSTYRFPMIKPPTPEDISNTEDAKEKNNQDQDSLLAQQA